MKKPVCDKCGADVRQGPQRRGLLVKAVDAVETGPIPNTGTKEYDLCSTCADKFDRFMTDLE